MNVVKTEKCRGIIIEALNRARKGVLDTQDESCKSGKIYVSTQAKEKERLAEYAKNALSDSSYDAKKAFAVFGFTNMTFGLGNYDNGLVFLDDGVFFKGSGGGYSMEDFYIRYEDFANADSVGIEKKGGDQRFGKRDVVSIATCGKTNLIDLTNTGCAPTAFVKFMSGLKDSLNELLELDHETVKSTVKSDADDPDEELVSVVNGGDANGGNGPSYVLDGGDADKDEGSVTVINGGNARGDGSVAGCRNTGKEADVSGSGVERALRSTKDKKQDTTRVSKKKRIVFSLLGLTLGFLGIHFRLLS